MLPSVTALVRQMKVNAIGDRLLQVSWLLQSILTSKLQAMRTECRKHGSPHVRPDSPSLPHHSTEDRVQATLESERAIEPERIRV